MKKKIIISVLTAICAGSCALASCGLFNLNRDDPYNEPLEVQGLDIRVASADGRNYGVVLGLGNLTLTDIEIPDTRHFGEEYGVLPVEVIQFEAFKDTAITSISIPSTIRYIGSNAFSGCTSLTTVTMEDGAEQVDIMQGAFEHCTSLSSVTLSNSVTTLGERAFNNCTALTSLTLPDNLCSAHLAFEGSSITYFDTEGCEYFGWESGLLINKNTTGGYIAEYANPEATEVTVPEGVTLLEAVFKNNKNIRRVDLNGTELYIGAEAFANSSLEELLNCQNVTNAALSDFEGTPWLENMLMGTENLIMGKVFMLYRGGQTDFSVPEGIETIGAHAFEGTAVQSITLPESIDEICNYAFKDCQNLESLTINSYVPPFISNICLPEHTVVYARNYTYYQNNILWQNIPNEILPIA